MLDSDDKTNMIGPMKWTRFGVPHHELMETRREFLLRAGGGFGAIALAGLMAEGSRASAAPQSRPQFRARAKSVIFLFMEGGPSHLDTFDPKPLLNELAGQKLPDSFGRFITAMGEEDSPLLACRAPVEAARAERALGVRLAAAHRRPAPTISASSARAWPTASITPPASAR